MSAFVGIVELRESEKGVSDTSVQRMLSRLRHRVDDAGWSARHVQTHGAVGLGSAVLDSTPQARFEREHLQEALSLRTASGSALWIAGDLRLSARDELIARLQLNPDKAREWSDGRLALEAYARWGEDAPRELKGDFAFAIWDEDAQQLFCARDRFGVKPFYLAFVPGQVLAIANEIKALWPALPFGPTPDEAHIGDYLAGEFGSFERTFYQGVERLPPAHTLVLELSAPQIVRKNRYYDLDEERELLLESDDEYAARLRAGFERAVWERSRSAGRLATFLSGGLDSSSVAAVAARQAPPEKLPLLALSMVFARFKECDEGSWIEQNLAIAGDSLQREWVWGDDTGALNDIERVVWHLDSPPPGPNTCSTWTQYAPLQNAGVRVVLDGHGGDEVVFLGYQRIGELIAARRFGDARRELLLLKRHGVTNTSATPLLWAHLGQRARGTRFIGRFARALSGFSSARRKNPPAAPPSEAEEGAAVARELVRPEKRALLPVPAAAPDGANVRVHHACAVTGALQPLALEAMDALAGAHALDVRVPFWDEELVELCLSFPSDQKMRDGWNRWVMRRAMNGLIPEEVRWRRAKTNFAPQMIYGLRSIERARIEACLDEPGVLGEWMDVIRARALWGELQTLRLDDTRAAQIAFAIWRMMALGAWLRGLSSPDAPKTRM